MANVRVLPESSPCLPVRISCRWSILCTRLTRPSTPTNDNVSNKLSSSFYTHRQAYVRVPPASLQRKPEQTIYRLKMLKGLLLVSQRFDIVIYCSLLPKMAAAAQGSLSVLISTILKGHAPKSRSSITAGRTCYAE
jgi:hypothetical protein